MPARGRNTIVPFGRDYVRLTKYGHPFWPIKSILPEQNTELLTLNLVVGLVTIVF
jgi:hypothetical protein